MTAAGYVGIEPEASLWLAAAAERTAEDAGVRGRRIAALLAEAGEDSTADASLLELQGWLDSQARDVRRRSGLAAFDPHNSVDPTCAVPWTDPLVRAARAVWHNARNVGVGAWDSSAEGVTAIWQLVPGNDGWQRAWVDLGAGLADMVRDPKAAWRAIINEGTLEERGFSYWIGGFVPDVALYALGGAGAAKTATRVAQTAQRSRRLQNVVDHLPRRRPRGGDIDIPIEQRAVPRRNPLREWTSRRAVLAEDAASNGHSATKHGADTTLPQQRLRAEKGILPDGQQSYRTDASRFFRWQDQREAIERAKGLRQLHPDKDTFRIHFERPVGEGFMKNTLEYRRTGIVEVRFDENGRAYTSFPDVSEGWTAR